MKSVSNKIKLKNSKQAALNFFSINFTLGLAGCGAGKTVNENISTESPDGETFLGTAAADIIRGTDFNDNIYSSSGDDRIFGQGGNDLIYSQNGRDVVYAGTGDDTVYISDFDDVVDGGAGYDTIILEPSLGVQKFHVDFVNGELSNLNLQSAVPVKLTSIEKIISNLTADLRVTGIDAVTSISTSAGNDTISTGSQTSEVSTGAGNDVLQLDGFGHTVSLGEGDDILKFSDFFNSASGGSELDTLYFTTHGVTGHLVVNMAESSIKLDGVQKSVITGFESVIIDGSTSVEIIGSMRNDYLVGGSGNDRIQGNGGTDRIAGGPGRDTFVLSDNAFLTIEDFKVGSNGDVLTNITDLNTKNLIPNIKTIDLSGGGQTIVETSNCILIETSQISITNESELLALFEFIQWSKTAYIFFFLRYKNFSFFGTTVKVPP